ncbi:MAG: YicC family protein, partial [Christensenellales bacterium]
RGHVEIYITYKNRRSDAKTVELDQALLDAYMRALDGAEGLPDDRTRMGMARFPDVLVLTEAEEDQDALRLLMADAMSGALDALADMRAREGSELGRELMRLAGELERVTCAIEARYPATVDEHARRLRASIRELIGQEADEARVLTEVAVIADKSAIDEETVRLKSHIKLLCECFERDEPVGRRIDFIVQELNREVNTISSKSQDIAITNLVVEGKALIEKLREQVQNIE